MDDLRFPLQWDENHFWETSLAFSRSAVPSLDLLRSYDELNTRRCLSSSTALSSGMWATVSSWAVF